MYRGTPLTGLKEKKRRKKKTDREAREETGGVRSNIRDYDASRGKKNRRCPLRLPWKEKGKGEGGKK